MASNYNNPINILDTKNAIGLGSGGSLNVEGGASIKQDTFIGGSLSVSGTSTAFSDNIMIMNKNPTSTKDTGILFERYIYVNEKKYSGLIYNETSDEFIFGYANSDNSGTGITFGNYIPIRANQLLLMSTENSIGLGSGGSLTVLGGASISKTLNVSNLSVISNNNTTLTTTGGNVGIGTSAPSKSLDIIGDINLTGDFYKNGDLYNPGSQWTTFSNNVVYTKGNIGINTTSPNTTLDVNGTANFSSSITTSSVNATTLVSSPSYTGGSMSLSGDLVVGGSVVTVNVTTTNVKDINISTGTINVSDTAYITNATIPNLTITNLSGATLTLSTGLTSASAQLTNANVTTSTVATLLNTNAVSTNISSATLTLSTGLTSASAQLTNANVTTSTIATARVTTSLLAIGNSNTIGNIFTTGGNVGIGTSPSRKLHVQSDMRIGGSGAVLDFGDDFTTQIFRNATTSEMRFNTNSLERMTITSTGNLGIGTNSPIFKLDVAGNGRFTGPGGVGTNGSVLITGQDSFGHSLYVSGAASNKRIGFQHTGTVGSIFAFEYGIESPQNLCFQLPGGNVGIGISSPTAKLDVSGTIRASTSLTTGAVYSTNITSTNVVATNVSAGTLNLSTGLTSASAQITNANVTTSTVATLLNTDAVSTNISSATLNLSTGLISSSAQLTNANVTTATIPTLLNTNIISTNISGGTINATTFTGGNLSLSGDLKVAGTLTTVNITSTNLVNTNVSAGVVVASTLLSATGNSNTIGSIFTTGGNVGIGITSPSNTLDVSGTIRASTSLTTGAVYSTNITSTNIVATNISSGTLNLSTGLTSASAQLTNANVTTSTVATLLNTNAVSTNISSATLNLSTGLTSANAQLTNANVTTSTIATARVTTSLLAIGNSNTVGAIITTGGNVGIGTASPNYTLDVTGSFRLNSTAVQNFVIGSTSGTASHSTYLVSSHGNLEIGIAAGASSFNNSSIAGDVVIRSSKNLMLQSGALSPNLYIATSGNIGIACTAPTHLFSVGIAPNGTTKGSISINTSDESRYHLFNYAGVAEWLFGQKSTSRSDFTFSKLVAGTETDYLTISTGGNVGIGTTAPSTTLDVSGTIRASTSITTGALYSTNLTSTNIVATNLSAGSLGFSNISVTSATIGTSLLAIGNSNTVGAIITTGGNVGIGTTAPQALLHLHNTSMPELILSRYTSNISGGNLNHGELTWKSLNRGVDSAIIRSTSQAVDGLLGWDDAGRLEFLTSTGPGASLRMVISESGNVGIGTSTPGSILHVAGAAGSLPTTPSGNGVHMGIDTNSNSGIQLNAGSNGSGNYEYIDFSYSGAETVARIIHNNSNRSLLFQVNSGTNAMQLNSSGSVSIPGALSKGSGTFDIDHPILEDKRLVHSFIEGPRCDLIYRGAVTLTNGTVTVNIDTDCVEEMDCVMTEGTFTSLCANPQFFLQNPNSFNRLRGSISGNILTIICEDNTSTDEVYWQVIAERKDPFIKRWNRTNANGYLVTEYNKE